MFKLLVGDSIGACSIFSFIGDRVFIPSLGYSSYVFRKGVFILRLLS